MEGEGDASQRVLCRFTTKLSEEFRVAETDLAIPGSSTRYGLSQTVNALLRAASTGDEDEVEAKGRVFDFLVEGELLRGELVRHLAARDLSLEKTIVIEYFFAVEPPQPPRQRDLPDWIGAVRAARVRLSDSSQARSLVLTGCYDGSVSLHEILGGSTSTISPGIGSRAVHSDSVSALALVSVSEAESGGNEGSRVLVTASKDTTMKGWFLRPKGSSGTGSKSKAKSGAGGEGVDLVQVFEFVGHTASIESVCSSPATSRFASGGWDKKIRVWSLDEEDLAGAEANASKKAKVQPGEASAQSLEQVETTCLDGHKQSVSAVCWPEENLICSTSWDATVKCWDVSKGKLVSNLIRESVLFCLDASGGAGHGGSLSVAFGQADGVIGLWDPRATQSNSAATTGMATVRAFKSHKSIVSDVRWSPSSPFHLCSADYEGLVKVWDTRSAIPLHTLQSHRGKALCLDWADAGIVSGGEDAKLAFQAMRAW